MMKKVIVGLALIIFPSIVNASSYSFDSVDQVTNQVQQIETELRQFQANMNPKDREDLRKYRSILMRWHSVTKLKTAVIESMQEQVSNSIQGL